MVDKNSEMSITPFYFFLYFFYLPLFLSFVFLVFPLILSARHPFLWIRRPHFFSFFSSSRLLYPLVPPPNPPLSDSSLPVFLSASLAAPTARTLTSPQHSSLPQPTRILNSTWYARTLELQLRPVHHALCTQLKGQFGESMYAQT